MAQLITGERIGKTALIKVGCSVILFDESGATILLQQRTDNGRWSLPGGGMDPGESAEECCVREIKEETGLDIEVVRLVGIYTTPHRITTYADGNRWQLVALHFEGVITGGTMEITDGESHEQRFIPITELANYDIMEHHLPRIEDTLHRQVAAFVR